MHYDNEEKKYHNATNMEAITQPLFFFMKTPIIK